MYWSSGMPILLSGISNMSETKYESKIVSIPASAASIYGVLGNLENINKVRHLIPEDKVQELEVTQDYIRMKVDGLGPKVVIRVVDRIENDTLKFGFDNLPIEANFWIQIKEVSPSDSRLRLTIKADIPMMFRMMIGSKLQTGLDQAADMLAQFPYANWN